MDTKQTTRLSVRVCSHHLQDLYEAIERDDIGKVYQVEHELTKNEECVACAYALRAHGQVRVVLDSFLRSEGFDIENPTQESILAELRFWFIRLGLLILLFSVFSSFGIFLKSFIVNSHRVVSFSSFGWVAVFLMTLATFVFIEYEFLD